MKKESKKQKEIGSKTMMIKSRGFNQIRRVFNKKDDLFKLSAEDKMDFIQKIVACQNVELNLWKAKRQFKERVEKLRYEKKIRKFLTEHPEFKIIESANGALDEFISLQKDAKKKHLTKAKI